MYITESANEVMDSRSMKKRRGEREKALFLQVDCAFETVVRYRSKKVNNKYIQ